MNRNYIIWDFDGTLIDTYGGIVESFYTNLISSFGIKVPKYRILELVKIDTKHCANILASENKLNEVEVLESTRNYYNEMPLKGQEPFPFVQSICEKVQNNGGANFLVTHRDRKSLKAFLSESPFQEIFSEIITSNEGFPLKPDPTSFKFILNKYKLPASEVMGIGDRELDVQAANGASIKSVYFCPNGKQYQLADLSITCFSQLKIKSDAPLLTKGKSK